MPDSKDFVTGAAAFGQNFRSHGDNAPTEYSSMQKQYMKPQTKEFYARRAYLSSDFIEADVQGLTNDFYAYTKTKIRMSELSTMNKTSLVTKKIDDYREVLIPDASIDYLPLGAKIVAMGSTWIVTNPNNISSVSANAIVARCNASYSFYDAYGNIVTEPICVERAAMESNRVIDPLNMVLMNGYFNVVCQLNANTAKLSENSRLILGKKAYAISGYADFTQEFSGDLDSCHFCTFTLRVEEPTERDDLVNKIADGLPYPFSIQFDLPATLERGVSTPLGAHLLFGGNAVFPTADTPQTWVWTSDDTNIVNIVESGGETFAEGLAAGGAVLTVYLAQNPNLSASVSVTVGEQTEVVAFTGEAATEIRQYESETYTAAVFVGGVKTPVTIAYGFDGADPECYDAVFDGESVTVTCVKSSDTPLVIRATDEDSGEFAEISVLLYGY